MIQRIQSIYMILSLIVTGVLPFLFHLWKLENGALYFFMENMLYTILFGLSTTLTLVAIFSFKKRQNQFVMNRLNIIFNLILLVLFVYRTLNLSGEAKVSENGIGIFLPIGAIFLLALANKSIKKDENLVKSVDRLR